MRWLAIGLALGAIGCLSVGVSGQASNSSGGRTGGQTGGQSNGGQSTGQSAGSTTGPAPIPTCAPSSHYIGNVCVLDSCDQTSPRSPCLLGDGGIGVCIAGNCLGTATDPSNCGGPGYVCPIGDQCFDGQCWGPDGGSFIGPAGCENCPAGTACIDDPPFSPCVLQTCGPSDDDRACGQYPGSFCCHGACVSDSDNSNCGGCDTTCPAGTICGLVSEPVGFAAGCIGAATCAVGAPPTLCGLDDGRAGHCCSATCADWDWDSANCGGCGLSCPAGGVCDAGQCPGSSCDDTSCPSDEVCIGGSLCAPNCAADGADGQFCQFGDALGTCCGGQCVWFFDRANCGGCGVACFADQVCESPSGASFYNASCVAAPSCAEGGAPCIVDGGLGTCCGTTCVDINSNMQSCGQCGFGCPAGAICQRGGCVTESGTAFGQCGKTTPCPAGEACVGGLCTSGCDGTTNFCALPSGAPGLCCGTKCTDIGTDADNCGSCGTTCPAGSACGSGTGDCTFPDSGLACPAVPCPSGTICTRFGSCAPLGDCSSVPPNDGCMAGDCTRVSPVQASCLLSSSKTGTCCNGQCTDLGEDPNNCGLCNLACASGICAPYGDAFFLQDQYLAAAGSCLPRGPSVSCLASCGLDSTCLNGVCTPLTSTGAGPCLAADGTIGFWCANGVCIHPLDDAQNCGACGNACPPGVACVDGACPGSVCGNGHWGNFCGDAGERTCCPGADCTDTQTDALNCGGCGLHCPPGTSCNAGRCG